MGGRLPLNPHGGQLGEAYIHGMNGIAEAVRQVRGTSVNQVPGDGPVLVTAGTGVPTSGLILSLREAVASAPQQGQLKICLLAKLNVNWHPRFPVVSSRRMGALGSRP